MEVKKRIDLVHLLPDNPTVIECGVAEGLLTKEFLDAGVGKLYSVDNWQKIEGIRGDGNSENSWHNANYENVKKLTAPFGEKSVLLKGLSVEMAKKIPDNSCDLVYIDCDHTFQGVTNDILAYWPKLKIGGIMAFHDYEANADFYGVKEAVIQYSNLHNLEIHFIPENGPDDAGAFFYKK